MWNRGYNRISFTRSALKQRLKTGLFSGTQLLLLLEYNTPQITNNYQKAKRYDDYETTHLHWH
jgi:hypothetical protein